MAKIVGAEGLTDAEILREIREGGKLVVYEYAISILIMTFKRGSSVYLVRKDESGMARAIPFILITLVLGWWGFPWGPIYSIWALIVNLGGGRDVTNELVRPAA